jgi:hypothetical protein
MKLLMKKKTNINKLWSNIAHIYINGYLDTLPDSFRNLYSPKKGIKKVKYIFKNYLADFLRLFKTSSIPTDKIWFVVLTKNNFDALKPIQDKIPSSIVVSFFRFNSTINSKTHYFNLNLKFFYNIIYPFSLLKFALENKNKAKQFYDLFLTVNGSYEESIRLLKKKRPQGIVFANDHLIIARSLLLAANHLGIKTYYIQHATVSNYFPPLEFSYALLEGQDAYDKYSRCGEIKSIVKLFGMSKFDSYVDNINKNDKLETLGIAFNLIDEIEPLFKIVCDIKNMFSDLKIVIRPHPGDSRDLSVFDGFEISNSKQENAFNYLSRIDAIVAGDSSIHLEAVLINVYPIYYLFNNKKVFDYYGFVKNKLVSYCKTKEQLYSIIDSLKTNKENIQDRATYYNAVIGTPDYGKSTLLISDFILESLKNTQSEE